MVDLIYLWPDKRAVYPVIFRVPAMMEKVPAGLNTTAWIPVKILVTVQKCELKD